jgi:hypothetical protein
MPARAWVPEAMSDSTIARTKFGDGVAVVVFFSLLMKPCWMGMIPGILP